MLNLKEAQSNGLHQSFNFSQKLCQPTLENKTPSTIVLIDSAVDDYQSLVKGVIPKAEVIVLDATRDGVVQITEVLQGRTNIAAIHIVSHGSPGCLYLGNTQLSLDTLERYSSQLQTWATPLTSSILLYGCNVAAGDAGAEFVERLHRLTGVDIAGSANRIGAAALGGSWELEVATSKIEVPLVFQEQVRLAYNAVLGSFIVDSIEDIIDPNDGVTTLREAIEQANNQSGKYIIEFDPTLSGQTITLTNGPLKISDDLFINGLGADKLTISGGNNSPIFLIDDGNYSNLIDVGIEGLTIADGRASIGGGIWNKESLTITNSTITRNEVNNTGGAILNDGGAFLTITNGIISNNLGGTDVGAIENLGTMRIANSTISNNTTRGSFAGGIRNFGILEVSDSTITGNSARVSGGGISNNGTLRVSDSTISGNSAGSSGGGIYSSSGTLVLANTIISDNLAGEQGGGIYSDGFSTWEVSDSIISGNTVLGNDFGNNGGGIYNTAHMSLTNSIITDNTAFSNGGIYNTGTLTLDSSTISNNEGRDFNGGIGNSGILTLTNSFITDNQTRGGSGGISNSGTVTLDNSIISGNNGTEGGGIGNIGLLTLTNSTINNNTGSNGGGIDNSGTLTVSDSTISGNTGYSGGGIYNVGTVTVTSSTLSSNTAIGSGSGILNENAGILEVTNSTISGNSAQQNGGGIDNNGTLTLTSSTITANIADSDGDGTGNGGGIYNNGTAEVRNTIIAGNFDNSPVPNPSHPDVSGSFTTNNFNLIGNPIGSTGFENDKTFASEGITAITQVLDPVLSDNGGFTQTHALVLGSPAIDMAAAGVTTDQRGVSRPFGSNSDIGAVEFVPLSDVSNITVDTLVDENDGDLSPGNVSLREAILFSSAGGTINFDPSLAGGTITLSLGELLIDKNLTINGLGADQLTISGNNTFNVFNINDGNSSSFSDVVIEGLTIANGFGLGGGIYNSENLTVNNSTIRNNSAGNEPGGSRGGGIWNDGNLTASNSTISDNFAASSGGGIFNNNTLTLIDSTISGNTAAFWGGGGIEMLDGTLTVINSTISGNSAGNNGGGIYIGSSPNTLTVINSTISGNSAGNDGGGIYSIGSPNTLEVTNSTISCNFAGNSGGGIEILDGTLTVTDSTITSNSAFYNGGIGNSGTLTLDNSTISNNEGRDFNGGIGNSGILTLINSFITDNQTRGGSGGISNSGTVTLDNSIISGNNGTEGGGIGNIGLLTLTNSTINNNTGSRGGGIDNSGTLTVSDSTISGNTGYSGGGIYNVGTVTVTSSTLSSNTAIGSGSGILNENAGILEVTNSTISGNSAQQNGGGIDNNGTLTLTSSTITANIADSDGDGTGNGGGIYNNGTVVVSNTIIAGNFDNSPAPNPIHPDVSGSFTTTSFNLIGDATGSTGFTDGVNGNIVGTKCNPIDPLLGPLQDNGGPTFTHALLPGSPAINAGNNANIPDGITTDQRGEPRIVGDTVDIGAFEAALFSPIVICCCEHNGDPWNTTNNQLSAFSTDTDINLIPVADCWV